MSACGFFSRGSCRIRKKIYYWHCARHAFSPLWNRTGKGGRKSWQIGPKMSFPFFFSLSVSLLKTCGIVSALYRLYKRSFLFFQLKRFSIEHKELWNVFSISIRKYHWTFYSIKLSTGLLVYRTVKTYFESFQSNRK